MFDSMILDISLGLILFFLVLSLLCSAIQEWIASACGLRSRNLRDGIDHLLGADIAKAFYGHGLFKSLYRQPGALGLFQAIGGNRGAGPSYIEPHLFVDVLIDVIDRGDGQGAAERDNAVAKTFPEIEKAVTGLPAGPVREALFTLLADAADESDTVQQVEAFRKKAAEWFDAAMDRASGWYARTVKVWLFVIATFVVLVFNADAIEVGNKLWKDEALRAAMAAAAQQTAAQYEKDAEKGVPTPAVALSTLEKFPIGWACQEPKESKESKESNQLCFCDNFRGVQSIFGWLVSIVACSFGAPFWFGALSKVVSLRGSGKPPKKTPTKGTAES